MVVTVSRVVEPIELILNATSRQIIEEILSGVRSHKDLKIAFDWEKAPEGHRYWSCQRQSAELSGEAKMKLERALMRSTHEPV